MLKPKSESWIKSLIFHQATLAILGLGLIITISLPLYRNFVQKRNIENEISGIKQEVESVEKKNTELRRLINYLGSKQYLEEQARLNFNLKEPGENMAIISNPNQQSTATKETIYNLPPEINTQKQLGYLPLWMNYFFKN